MAIIARLRRDRLEQMSFSLALRNSDPANQVVEARIVADGVPHREDSEGR
jgi:hypothetical protein